MSNVRVRYQTIEFGEMDVHLRTLRDRQQFADDDHVAEDLGIASAQWPLFGVVWESGEILARLMHTYDIKNLKVLEVGCGIGLASIVLSRRKANITATDHHPEAAPFLLANAKLNHLNPIPFVRTGWCDEQSALGKFDLIIGSDLLYEKSNVTLLSDFIHRHSEARCNVIIVDPGRGLQSQFARRMVALGYTHDSTSRVEPDLDEAFNGRIVKLSRP